MHKIMIFLLFTGCSVTMSEADFKEKLFATFDMNNAAESFFIREQKDLVPSVDSDVDTLEFDIDGEPSYVSASTTTKVWSFVSYKKNRAVYRLLNKDAYIGVILDGNVLLVNTNLYSSPNQIKYEWMTSFALKK